MSQPVRQLPFTVVSKPTGAACNLDCTYCFFLSKELLYNQKQQNMSLEVGRQWLAKYLQAQGDGPVTVVWQGGEPTLRGLEFFAQMVAEADRLKRPGQEVSHAIQTNGTLLDAKWGEFLAKHDFLVGISIDGPRQMHDSYRVNRAGRGSFDQVMRGLEVLKTHGVKWNVLATVHAANQDHPREVYRFFRDDLEAEFIQFIPIVERVSEEDLDKAEKGWNLAAKTQLLYRQEGSAVTSRSVDPRKWGEFLASVFDEWVVRDIGRVYVQHFDEMLNALFGRHTVCVHAETCGDQLALEFNGDVYSCDHYVEPGYRLGNITDRDANFPDFLESAKQRAFGQAKAQLPSQCLNCRVRKFCNGGCPKDRFTTTADGEAGLNYLCEGYYRFFTHARPDMIAMGRLITAGQAPAAIMDPQVRARMRPGA